MILPLPLHQYISGSHLFVVTYADEYGWVAEIRLPHLGTPLRWDAGNTEAEALERLSDWTQGIVTP